MDAGIPEDKIIFKQKQEQALEMIYQAKNNGIRYNWVGCDGLQWRSPSVFENVRFSK
ncbi:hypothetical protein QUF74_17625 [Candidatus Halobeggiatoa sp. HSG11]|nr:hypothetical protein [Candidatus Halobeggiatoa sp. HSG11]